MMLFEHIIQTSYQGLVACLLIFMIRLFVQKFGSAKWCVYMWILLIVSLLLPQLPTSEFSFYRSPSIIRSMGLEDGNDVSEEIFLPDIGTLVNSAANRPQNTDPKLIWVWRIGAGLQALYFLIAWCHILHIVRCAKPISEDIHKKITAALKGYGLDYQPISIRYNDNIKTPFLVGLRKPYVLLPSTYLKNMDSQSLAYVVLHEYGHWRRKDHIVHSIGRVLSIFYWFHVPLRFSLKTMYEDMEVATDELTCTWLGQQHIHSYAQTLLTCAKTLKTDSYLPITAFSMGKQPLLKRRIHNMLHKKDRPLFVKIFLALLLIACPFMILTTAEETVRESHLTQEWQWPLENYYQITSAFGKRIHPVLKTEKTHTGIDISTPIGTEILSINNGQVIYAGQQGGYGNMVILKHSEDLTSVYAHLDTIMVNVEDNLSSGDVIGTVGTTGATTGPNLHLEIRINGEPVDPMDGYLINPIDQ